MDTLIVTGAVVAFLLLILPAVVVPFLGHSPSTVDIAPWVAPDPTGGRSVLVTGGQEPTDRIAA